MELIRRLEEVPFSLSLSTELITLTNSLPSTHALLLAAHQLHAWPEEEAHQAAANEDEDDSTDKEAGDAALTTGLLKKVVKVSFGVLDSHL